MPKLTTQTHTPETLTRIANDLHELAARLEGYAGTMRAEKIESIAVPHQYSLVSGMKAMETFADGTKVIVKDILINTGAYGVPDGASPASPNSTDVPKRRRKSPRDAK